MDTDEVFYVGIGITKNYTRAYNKTHRNHFWNNIVNKTKYIVEIVLDNIPYDILKEKEQEFIKLYGRKDKNSGTLVNLTDGGDGILGCHRPSKGKGKTWEEICPNAEQVRINRENRSFPYIITVKEPDGNIFDVYCENIPDFYKKLKITTKYLTGYLKRGKTITIERIKKGTKHSLKVGTVLSYTPIIREKQNFDYPPPPPINRCKPFIVIVSEPYKQDYEVLCENNKDFFKKIGKDTKSIASLKNGDHIVIQKTRVDSVHNFPIGTKIRLKGYLPKPPKLFPQL